ncbi:hypothetical protein BDFG_03231 [Blastomyces dermatitidis ATCC 26199]|nr:hypothetical protein BDFG_03231 [Blastomyces dermatitidis ATCC 26199]
MEKRREWWKPPLLMEGNLDPFKYVLDGTGDRAHWGLFIPNRTADPTGTLMRVMIGDNDDAKVRRRSGGATCEPVLTLAQFCKEDCLCLLQDYMHHERKLKMLRERASQGLSTIILLNNCQMFTIDVWMELNTWKIPISDPANFNQSYPGAVQNNSCQNSAISRPKQTKHWRASA